MDSEKYRVKTSVGIFRVEKSVSIDYQGNYKKDLLKIGGNDFCVEYEYIRTSPEKVTLQWLTTEKMRCEEGGVEIRKEKTVHLFDLSVKLLKRYIDVKEIILLDNSKFKCKLPDDSVEIISLSHYHFLYHKGKTWYSDKFGAVPIQTDEKTQYESWLLNFDDPTKKPKTFDFKNDDLNAEFEPVWYSTATWTEFLETIKTQPNICQKTYPWVLYAFYILSDKRPLPSYWKINVNLRPNIEYTVLPRLGGKRKRKDYKYKSEFLLEPNFPNYEMLKVMKFTSS